MYLKRSCSAYYVVKTRRAQTLWWMSTRWSMTEQLSERVIYSQSEGIIYSHDNAFWQTCSSCFHGQNIKKWRILTRQTTVQQSERVTCSCGYFFWMSHQFKSWNRQHVIQHIFYQHISSMDLVEWCMLTKEWGSIGVGFLHRWCGSKVCHSRWLYFQDLWEF